MTLGQSLLPSGTLQWALVPPPGCSGDDQGTWKTFYSERLLISEDTRVGELKRETPGSRRVRSLDPRNGSREISSLSFLASASPRPWRRHVSYSQGRPVSLRRRRSPALLPLARQSPRLPTCPSVWAHPALGRPHPGGAARPSTRASLGPPAAGCPSGCATGRRRPSPRPGLLLHGGGIRDG